MERKTRERCKNARPAKKGPGIVRCRGIATIRVWTPERYSKYSLYVCDRCANGLFRVGFAAKQRTGINAYKNEGMS